MEFVGAFASDTAAVSFVAAADVSFAADAAFGADTVAVAFEVTGLEAEAEDAAVVPGAAGASPCYLNYPKKHLICTF